MKIISGTADFTLESPTAVAIGKFDGVHLGHRLLLNELIQQKKNGLSPTILTFDPSPEIFFGYGSDGELSTKEEKRKLFEEAGIETLIEFPFNSQTATVPAEDFVLNVLLRRMKAQFIAAGPDLSFGDKGKGNFELLRVLAAHEGCDVRMIDKLRLNGYTVSSTLIRSCVHEGEMEKTAEYLGTPYSIRGTVIHGLENGRKIGFPTVNLVPDDGKILPPKGVFFSKTCFDGKEYRSITNIGNNPTVGGISEIRVETHIFEFDGDIYDKQIEVKLLHFHRPERKFEDFSHLQLQIEADAAAAREYLEENA